VRSRRCTIEVPGDVCRVVEQASEVERAHVVELLAGDGAEHWLDVLDPPLQRRVASNDVGLCGLEHAIVPPQNDERQDHPPVLGLLVDAPQLVRDGPDEGGVASNLLVAAHLMNPVEL
jgi:hypothetical protein